MGMGMDLMGVYLVGHCPVGVSYGRAALGPKLLRAEIAAGSCTPDNFPNLCHVAPAKLKAWHRNLYLSFSPIASHEADCQWTDSRVNPAAPNFELL